MSSGEVINGYRNEESRLERGSDMWMEANQSSARLFEKSKISALRDEREGVQKKTFTKWVNSHLQKVGAHINDLYHDLQDGRQLILLLEILSAEKLPRPSKGRMRIHMLENVDKSLQFLKVKEVYLTNIGSHDIVDGNPKITLGLIWTIILRFQIQDLMIEMDSTEKRSAKDALLLWCQSKAQGYKNVNITNFTTSWRDGLAFNAIIHKHRPDLIEFDKLVQEEPITNLNVAFDTAERELGILPLLDAPDVNVNYPDEKSIMTYVATYYQYFSKMKQVEVSGSRIQKVIKHALDNEKLIQEYENLSLNLMQWIQEKIIKLKDRSLGNSLVTLQQQMTEFNLYRIQEKPPKFVEKCSLEVQMFEITSQLRLNHQKMYSPPKGLLVNDINKAWQEMEQEEHKREVAIRDELIRQQELEEIASRFERKAKLRDAWLNENCKLLSTDNFGEDLPAVEASVKKHEAIETDIKAYEARINGVEQLAAKLEKENFHRIDSIKTWTGKIKEMWLKLLQLLDWRNSRLNKHLHLHKVFQEMIYIIDWMDEIKGGLLSEDYGKHLLGVEDLLQKHDLVEADISAQAERVQNTNTSADTFLEDAATTESDGYKPDVETIKSNQLEMKTNYKELCDLAQKRRQRLEESLKLHTFYRDMEEEDIWLSEKEYFVSSTEYGHDSHTTTLLLQQHKTLEQELTAKKVHTDELVAQKESLLQEMLYANDKVNEHVETLSSKWDVVNKLSAQRRKRLEEVLNLHQFFADCREIEVDMNEMEAPVAGNDYGHDDESVNELIRKHGLLAEEISALEPRISSMEEQKLNTLGEQDQDAPEVLEAKQGLDDHYNALQYKMSVRHQKLLDALALYKLYSEADIVKSWVVERRSQLTVFLKVERTDDLERCKVIELRYDGFEKELEANTDRMKTVNELAEKIIVKDPTEAEEVQNRIDNLNLSWEALQKDAADKKTELATCLMIQHLYSEMTETQSWILEKSRLLASVEDPGADLSSVITLQRRLNSIERDIAALPSKMQDLHAQAVDISRLYPEEAVNVQTKFDDLQTCWDDLSRMVKQKNESLAEMGELKRFIMSLDDFLNWLQQTSEPCSSEDLPQSLSEAESLLDAHFELQTVIEDHLDDYNLLMDEGPKYIRQDQNDLQTQSLRQQMEDVKNGWQELYVLWNNRKVLLEQSMNYQLFLRDSKQCEAILGQQELYLSKQLEAPTADAVQEEIKNLSEFIQKMDTHDEKVNHIDQFADQLYKNNHYAKDKIKEKSCSIVERRDENRKNANELMAKLQEDLRLKQFLEDSDEVIDWMNERLQSASDESYKDLTNVRSKLIKHAAFEAELEANKTKIDALKKTGDEIVESNPETKPEIESRFKKIDELWEILHKASTGKKAHLSEANRQQQFDNEIANLDKWISEIQTTLRDKETGTDIATARALHNKHKHIEKDVLTKKQRMIDLSANPEEVDEEKIVAEQQIMAERFQSLEEPLQERKAVLDESLQFYQFKRDVEDALLWVDEKEPILKSTNHGDSLHDVQRSKKRHSNLCTEINGHEPLIVALYQRGDEMVNEDHPRAEEVQKLKDDIKVCWDSLKELSDGCQDKLDESLQAKQYFFDAAEAESWMSEKELFLLGDDRGKDEEHVQKMLKKHNAVENAIVDYGDTIEELASVAKALIDEKHPESESIQNTQTRIKELYTRLKDLADERQGKLDENLKLFQFNREIQDLESWIADREFVAGSQDIGQDFDQIQMLEERFDVFAEETRNVGTERVETVNAVADQLIGTGHSDATVIAEWKKGLNEAWENLLEMLNTRKEYLLAAHEYHRFFHEAKETLVMIKDKAKNLTEDLGRDQQSLYTLQRKHKTFEADLQPLGQQVEGIQDFSAELKCLYAGNKLMEISAKEEEVIQAWKDLLLTVRQRSHKLGQSDEYQRLIMLIQDLLNWMQDMKLQILSDEKPKDISACEHLMSIHQSRKAEMDTKEDKFKHVFNLTEKLIAKNHYATIEIDDKIKELREKKDNLEEEWDLHWEDLQLSLEVMQFARDAHLADDWMNQNEHSVTGKDFGKCLDEVDMMIEKHKKFERLINKQEDRFHNLERLTTFELRNARQKQLEAARKEKEEKERLERELAEAREREMELQRAREEEEKLEKARKTQVSPEALKQAEELMQSANFNENPAVNENADEVDFQPEEATEDAELQIGVEGIKMLGYLSRKPTKESQNKKAHSRVWKQFYVLMKDRDLVFFRDEKEAKQKLNPIQTITAIGSQVSVASDYHKKKNVLRLALASGAEYLMQSDSPDEMSLWIQHIRGSAVDSNAKEKNTTNIVDTSSPSRPTSAVINDESPSQETTHKKEKKRSSLFGKKKKSMKGETPT